jgi:hypothetical protein
VFQSPDLPPSQYTGGLVFPAARPAAPPAPSAPVTSGAAHEASASANPPPPQPTGPAVPEESQNFPRQAGSTAAPFREKETTRSLQPPNSAANPIAPRPATRSAPADPASLSIQPARIMNGRVAIVNANAGVCALNFPIGQLPAGGKTLTVYRHGVRVGEIKITGPQRDDNIIAEILSGELQPDDEARDR